jgi:hypothetical protein
MACQHRGRAFAADENAESGSSPKVTAHSQDPDSADPGSSAVSDCQSLNVTFSKNSSLQYRLI